LLEKDHARHFVEDAAQHFFGSIGFACGGVFRHASKKAGVAWSCATTIVL
jgi:hypothetical protein